MLKVLLFAATQQSTSPADVLKAVDAALFDVTLPEMFATMAVLRICADSGVIDYASAGHESVWLRQPNGDLRELSSTGPPVGTNFGMRFEEETFNAVPGTRLLLTTDGVTEAAAPDGTLFSRERLRQAFSESAGFPLQDVLTLIENRVDAHRLDKRLNDDVTLLVVEIMPGRDQT